MELVPSFMWLLQGLSPVMTSPTFASLSTVASGWLFAGRRTITRMILAAGKNAGKHFSSYHRLFSAARWSLERPRPRAGGRSRSAGRLPETAYDPPDSVRDLVVALRELSPAQRASIVLHDYAGYPASEIASIIGSTAPAVFVHLSRARKRLRTMLEDDDA